MLTSRARGPQHRAMRRSLCLVALAAVTLLPVAATAQRAISIATLAPPGSMWMRTLESAGRELRRRTNGALSIRFYAGGVQGDESEVVRKIRTRRIDGGALTATGLQHIHRPVLAFQLPALFRAPEEFLRAYTALQPELAQGFERAGFSLIHLSPSLGARMFSAREIRVPADLRNARPWQWTDDPILPALYAEAGATGVPLALPEVLSALQTRRIDTVYAPPLAAIALQWSSHVRYISERSASGSLSAIVLSRASFEALPPAERDALRTVFSQAAQLARPAFQRAEADAERSLLNRGITRVALTEPERQQWLELFARVHSRIARTLPDPAWIARVQAAGQPR